MLHKHRSPLVPSRVYAHYKALCVCRQNQIISLVSMSFSIIRIICSSVVWSYINLFCCIVRHKCSIEPVPFAEHADWAYLNNGSILLTMTCCSKVSCHNLTNADSGFQQYIHYRFSSMFLYRKTWFWAAVVFVDCDGRSLKHDNNNKNKH